MPRIAIISSGDLDGFFGLFVDNLVQLLLIVSLCGLCGISPDSPLLVQYILPGAAISIILGNLFYAFQAYRLARKEKRSDVTALPYGINTPSLLVYIFLVMLPAYQQVAGGWTGHRGRSPSGLAGRTDGLSGEWADRVVRRLRRWLDQAAHATSSTAVHLGGDCHRASSR